MSRSWVAARTSTPQRVRWNISHRRREHHRTEPDQEQIVARHVLAEKIDRALQSRRAAAQQIARPPDQDHEILDHQGQAERRQQLKQLGRVIDPPQQHHFDQHADHGDDQRRGDDAAPKTDRTGKPLGQRECHIGAEHVERAMGEIDDARHAEDDRQPRRHEEQRRRAGKTGQELNEVKGHKASAFPGSSASSLETARISSSGAHRATRWRLLKMRSLFTSPRLR